MVEENPQILAVITINAHGLSFLTRDAIKAKLMERLKVQPQKICAICSRQKVPYQYQMFVRDGGMLL